jgi:hypothetical protein
MHILYVDEAGDGGTVAGSSKHLVLAGAAMHEAKWRKLTSSMDGAQLLHFPQAGSTLELHASPLRGGRRDFRGISKKQRFAAMNDIYGRIGAARGLTLFAAIVDKNAFLTQYHGRVDPYAGAFEGLCTMFNYFLRRLQRRYSRPERGIVVLDESSPSLSNQLRVLLAQFQASGTRWDTLSQIIETPFFFDSKTSRIMQIADFCSYAVFRWYEAGDSSYISRIHHKFDCEAHKLHGLKCYPLACTKTYLPAAAVPVPTPQTL